MQRRGERPQRLPGARPRTSIGTPTERIPRSRSVGFFPNDVIERRRCVDRALVAAVAEMYATGTSTRKVHRTAKKMSVSRLSKDQVSTIASGLNDDIEEPCASPPTACRCPTSGSTRPTSSVAARGVSSLPPWSRPSAAMRAVVGASWASTWRTLSHTTRGSPSSGRSATVALARRSLDANPGLVRAFGMVFQGAAWQRRAVHLMRCPMREVSSTTRVARAGLM